MPFRIPSWSLFILFLGISGVYLLPQRQNEVRFLVLQTRSYCGGAEPMPEEIQFLQTPAPYPGKKLYLKRGTENNPNRPVIDSLVAGDDGWALTNLRSGSYVILHPLQRSPDAIQPLLSGKYSLSVDEHCLTQWNQGFLGQFSIGSGEEYTDTLLFHVPCFQPEGVPCIAYTGEYPP